MVMEKEKIYQELIDVLKSQVIDLTMMSKIELGDDVIEKINSLQQQLNMDSLKKIEYINNTPTPTQGWQRCPICEGTGIYQGQGTFHEIPTCPTCNGKRIISTLTGLPPQ